ncbi:COX15/CtaA family protein [Candidatus Accumulibacter sp. ACC003]|uniref:COX15/CtaA family protein n=1 Tax=Candidatus Accumulibacter sp. ACC003 TaxID=2823334 RepID=UPI0025BE0CB9|nr:COX15/CtaA family protein [Candidatus Accumulibacter sp. ACC003]
MISSPAWRLRRIHRTALLLTALSLLVVLLSAYLRLNGAGLACANWPACYGQLLRGEVQAPALALPRLLHRAAASLILLLVGYLLWLCLRRPSMRQLLRPATLLAVLVLALALLGFWSSDPRLLLVGFLNILGGLGLVTCSWRVVLVSSPAYPERARASTPTLALRLGAAVLSLTVVVGALIGAGSAALACPSFPDCGGQWWPAAVGWPAWQGFATLAAVPPAGDTAAVTLHLLHRWGALAALLLLLAAAALQTLTDDATRKLAVVLLLLLAGEVALGGLVVRSGFNLSLAVAHVVGAAALLAALSSLRRR